MSAMESALAAQRDSVALVGPDGTTTRGELLTIAQEIATALAAAPAGCVGLRLDNGPSWVAADLGALMAGRICIPVPSFFSAEQTAHVAESAGIRTWLMDTGTTSAGTWRVHQLASGIASGIFVHTALDAPNVPAAVAPAGTAKITFTSGTTGRPKGVCLSQETLEAVAGSVAALARDLELRRHICALPLALLLENVAGVYAPLLAGGEVVLPGLASLGWQGSSALDVRKLLGEIGRWEPDSMILVPELLHALVSAVEQGAPAPRSLRFVAVGGGRVSSGLLARAAAVGLPVYEGYGLSECASVVALSRPGAVRAGTVGRPLPHAKLEIACDGEVIVRGPSMLGYLGDPPHPTPGCVATGDIGSLRPDGFLVLSGRKRNVFITSHGRNVSPEWVESELAQTPAIAQAAVFGEARPYNVAVLVVRAPDDTEVSLAVAAVNERLPDYARVHAWVVAKEPFTPLNGQATSNGRIRREAIEAVFARELASLCPQDVLSCNRAKESTHVIP